jgi:hypothetical protein
MKTPLVFASAVVAASEAFVAAPTITQPTVKSAEAEEGADVSIWTQSRGKKVV